jgi:predicted transposase/invertase (TIGR01784 family)
MSKRTHLTLHDKFFKTSMQDVRIAHDFFKAHLPTKLQKVIRWDSLELQSGSFIDADYASKYTDVLYRADISKEAGYIYVLSEHQPSPDRFMPLRLWHYLCNIWDRHIKQADTEQEGLPLIYPVVLYHGKQSPYPYSMDLFDLFQQQDFAKELLLHQPFKLIDLTVLSDDELSQHGYVGAMELLQKHIYRSDILPTVCRVIREGLLKSLEQLDTGDYVLKLVTYVLVKGEVSSKDKLLDIFIEALPGDEEKIMTGAEWLRQEGMQQGMQQGMQAGVRQAKVDHAKSMIQLGLEASLITQVTGLSEEELLEFIAG